MLRTIVSVVSRGIGFGGLSIASHCAGSMIAWVLSDAMPWTPYADWIFTVVSTGSILLIAWLVLRPRP
jgi:hypothetical protein